MKDKGKSDDATREGLNLKMPDASPEDALRAFMQVDPEKVKGAEEKEKTVEEILNEAAPLASQIVLGSFIDWSADDVARRPIEALTAVIQKLPSKGKVRRKAQIQIIKAMTWVLGEVPADAEGRDDVATVIDALVERI